jgi:hypothetical protein
LDRAYGVIEHLLIVMCHGVGDRPRDLGGGHAKGADDLDRRVQRYLYERGLPKTAYTAVRDAEEQPFLKASGRRV